MSWTRRGRARTLAAVVVGTLLTTVAATRPVPAAASSSTRRAETRALWVLRSSLSSPRQIAVLVDAAKRHGFNTLLVQVRGRGDAYYHGIEPRAELLARQPPSFDPLAVLLSDAHAAGLRVHAWVNVSLVSSATDLPDDPDHVVHRRPDWLMVPRDLAADLWRLEPKHPSYVRRLARWTRGRSDVEGLYASPITRPAADHLVGVVRDLARRYRVDGIHFDYARYPNDDFDYSRIAVGEFRKWVEPQLSAARRRELAARAWRRPLAFPDDLPAEWRRFRTSRLTTLMARLRDAVKSERPGATVSVAAAADPQEARVKLQDWPAWLRAGIVDVLCPMAYTTAQERFTSQITAAVEAAGARHVWAGIGAYQMTPAQTIRHIDHARRLGADGVILFSYDSLIDPRNRARDYLGVVSRAAFAAPDADDAPR
jgi:uncharacterized lipoprotein YddW (UPF0748 family)